MSAAAAIAAAASNARMIGRDTPSTKSPCWKTTSGYLKRNRKAASIIWDSFSCHAQSAILRRLLIIFVAAMPRLAVATTNRGKLREIRQLLAGVHFELVTLEAWPDVAA